MKRAVGRQASSGAPRAVPAAVPRQVGHVEPVRLRGRAGVRLWSDVHPRIVPDSDLQPRVAQCTLPNRQHPSVSITVSLTNKKDDCVLALAALPVWAVAAGDHGAHGVVNATPEAYRE